MQKHAQYGQKASFTASGWVEVVEPRKQSGGITWGELIIAALSIITTIAVVVAF